MTNNGNADNNATTPADVIAAAEYQTWSHALCDVDTCTHDERCFAVDEDDNDKD